MGVKLVGYLRVSRVAGREGPSFITLDVQRERILALAKANGHKIIAWEQDLDQPGSRYERPGFQAALEVVEQGGADGIAVARLDRFARSVGDAGRALERLEAAGGTLVAVDLGMDASTSAGKLMRNVLMALAEFELERTRENWQAAGAHAVARGVHVCKVPPVGYLKAADGTLAVDPHAGPVVREVFQRRAAGASWTELCGFLDERLPKEKGGWTKSTVTSLIGRRTYLGEAKGGGHVNVDAHPPLVTRSEFDAAQLAKADGRHARGADGGALLAGIIRCDSCGHVLTRLSDGARGYANYKCRKIHGDGVCEQPVGVSIHRADGYIEELFLAMLDKQPLSAIGTAVEEAGEAQLALERAERELAEYQALNLVSVIGKEAFLTGVTERQDAIDQARLDLGESNARLPLAQHRDLRKVWPTLDVREKRHLLTAALDRVVVRPAPGAGKGTPVADRLDVIWR